MSDKIGIEIVGNKYVALLDLEKMTQKKLRLTTIKDFQSRAIIRVFHFHEKEKKLLKEIEIKQIPPEEAGEPDIDLFGEYDGKKWLKLNVTLNQRPYMQVQIRLKISGAGEEKRRVWVWGVAAGLFIVVVLMFLWRSGRVGFGVGRSKGGEVSGVEEAGSLEEVAGYSEEAKGPEETAGYGEGAKGSEETAGYGEGSEAGGETVQTDAGSGSEQGEASIEETTEETSVAVEEQSYFEEVVVYFQPSSAELTPSTRQALERIAELLEENPGEKVSLSGHCALYGTEWGREKLSELRARRVYEYLVEKGWEPSEEVEIEGFGARQPATEDRQEEHLNRRVEIRIVSQG